MTVIFTPSPLAFAENSVLMVLKSCAARGLSSWQFPAKNKAVLESLASRGIVDYTLDENDHYHATLTTEARKKFGV